MKRIIELFCQRYKLCSSLLIIFILLMISYLIYINKDNDVKAGNEVFEDAIDIVKENAVSIDNAKKIKVDVKGLVTSPGVYELDEGSRVIDAINASGGLAEEADVSSLNLSKILNDENVIIINSNIEQEPEKIVEYIYQECVCPEYNDACISEGDIVNYQNNNSSNSQKNETNKENNDINTLISINTASSEQLQMLSGVGESKAFSIIKYREENGPFQNIEDIKNVSGIGDALFAKIKDNITV